MNVKKNLGFTLIELLVSIVIMGILLAIAIPQISKLKDDNKTKKYEVYKESMERSAKLYTDSNANDMFKNANSGCEMVPYSKLKSANLLKDFQEKGISCSNDNETFVMVVKANDEYDYKSNIVCRDNSGNIVYQEKNGTTCENVEDNIAPEIKVTPDNINVWTKSENFKKIQIGIKDSGVGLNKNVILKYQWVKENGSINNKNWKIIDYKNEKYETRELKKSVSNNSLPKDSGRYYLYIDATKVVDSVGNKNSNIKSYGPYLFDNVAPNFNVSFVSSDPNYNTLTPDLYFTATDDVEDSSLLQYYFSKSNYMEDSSWKSYGVSDAEWNGTITQAAIKFDGSYDGENRTLYLSVKDQAGNIYNKAVDYKVYKECDVLNSYEPPRVETIDGNLYTIKYIYDQYTWKICDSYKLTGPSGFGETNYCSSVYYKDGNSCSKKCGGGTKNQLAYSTIDGRRCESKDKSSGGSSCNTMGCCSKVRYEQVDTCSKKCGSGNKKRKAYSIYNNSRCDSKDDFNGSKCNTQECEKTLKTCRAGNTCIRNAFSLAASHCYYVVGQGTTFTVKTASNGNYWKILSGTYKGYYIRKGCINSTGKCDYSSCPG